MSRMTTFANWGIPKAPHPEPLSLPSERFVQIGIAMMVSLGTLLLGMGERNATLPVLAVIVSISSVYLTDIRGWLQFNRAVSNFLALSAMAWTLWGFGVLTVDLKLLSVANLLVYLQFILQYQRKTVRTYWLLALLSLVQAAVSTALNLQIMYGFLLLIYTFVSLATMTIFFLYRETLRQQSGSSAHAALTVSQQVVAVQRFFSQERKPSRLPLFTSRGTLQIRKDVTSWLFVRQIIMLALGSLVLSMLVFVSTPRVGQRPWQRTQVTTVGSTSGFNESVSLGQVGKISDNPAGVMRAQFSDAHTGEPYEIRGELYFRGVVLPHYRDGRWTHYSDLSKPEKLETKPVPVTGEVVRQEITLEPLDTNVLFSLHPSIKTETNPNVQFDENNLNLMRPNSMRGVSFSYELATTSLDQGRLLELSPTERGRRFADLRLPRGDRDDPLATIRELANELVADIPATETYQRIQAIQEYLQDQSNFGYSLTQSRDDTTLDPIVDFVMNTREGHCEYFASAMALMLRSIGIPARMVIGYKTSEWNPIGGYYVVRQLHAHAWAEAYLAPGEIPNSLVFRGGPGQAAWLRLDPTPQYSGVEAIAGSDSRWQVLRQFGDYLDFLWSHYVLGMDARRQQEHVYTPLVQGISRILQWVQDPQAWKKLGQRGLALMGIGPNGWVAGEWFYWRAGLMAMVLSAVVYGIYRLLQRPVTWLFGRIRAKYDHVDEHGIQPIEFYRKLENTLRRHEIRREPNQTQQEFARLVGTQLADDSATRAVAGVPGQVAGAFYRVRFGQATLDRAEADAVEHALLLLENALAASEEIRRS